MKFFEKFKTKTVSDISKEPEETICYAATAKGKVVPMDEIPDDVFSQGVLGKCCGIDPEAGEVYAPIDGKIISLADSLHAVGIQGENGCEILIHVGVDTVEMNGDGFYGKVKEGEKVKKGQLLLNMDIEKIKSAGHPAVIINIVTNSDNYASIDVTAFGNVDHGDELMTIRK